MWGVQAQKAAKAAKSGWVQVSTRLEYDRQAVAKQSEADKKKGNANFDPEAVAKAVEQASMEQQERGRAEERR